MTDQTTPPAPGTPEYDSYMIAKGEGVQWQHTDKDGNTSDPLAGAPAGDPPPANAEEPQGNLILGKFKSQADLEAAYKELESKLGAPKKPAVADPIKPAPAPGETPPDGETPPAPSLQEAFAKAAQEFESSQEFSEETFAALEAGGISREYAQTYVEGLKARAEVVQTRVYGEAGGQEQYAAMQSWAAANMSAEQIEAHNRAVTSGDLNATLGAIRTLRTVYEATNGRDGRRVEPDHGSNAATQGEMFRTKTEVTTAMSDRRYRDDAGYRMQVQQKIERAMRAGVDLGF